MAPVTPNTPGSLGLRSEQRVCPRRVSSAPCWVKSGDVERYAKLADVSASGARVVTAAPPKVGETLSLAFSVAEFASPVAAEGRVVWRSAGFGGRGGIMGVAFSRVSSPALLRAFVLEADF